MERWLIKKRNLDPKNIARDFNQNNVVSEIISRRSLFSREELYNYLVMPKSMEYDPYRMKDMEKAVSIIQTHIKAGNKILISLDYDVDGVISGAIAFLALKRLHVQCECIFPHRVYDGYGINDRIIYYAKENNFPLIITFDNGISAFEPIKQAKELDIDVIVTDHHEVPQKVVDGENIDYLVDAVAIINPMQTKCPYPNKSICGGLIAYKTMLALYQSFGKDESLLQEEYSLASIATICDVIPLVDENRRYVSQGLTLISNGSNKGLYYLMKNLGIQKLNASDVGFRIGPCLNSSGRLSSAEKAYNLLISRDDEEANHLALELIEMNRQRKELTQDATATANESIQTNMLFTNNAIVLLMENVHESLAGIVAGRIKEQYNVPTIVFTKSQGVLKGSARSTEGFNLFSEVSHFREHFTRFGGHAAAAGMSMEKSKFNEFRDGFIKHMNQLTIDKTKEYFVDAILEWNFVSLDFVRKLEVFEPTGKGNPSLLFASKSLFISQINRIGKQKNVLKITFNKDNKVASTVAYQGDEISKKIKSILSLSTDFDIFGSPKKELFSRPFDILYRLSINKYKETDYLNIELVSIR